MPYRSDMHLILVFELLVLIGVANAAPLLLKRAAGNTLAAPLDGGATLADGRPLLGPSKTIRGVAASLVVTIVLAVLMGLGWTVGAVVAFAAMAGDVLSSFVKRRLGIPPSGMALGLDQIPESLLPFAAAALLLPLTLLDILLGTAIFFVASLVVSRLLFKLRVRDEPY